MKIDKVRVCLGCTRPIRKRGRFHRWVDGWGNKTCAYRWAGLGPHRPGHPSMKARQGAPLPSSVGMMRSGERDLAARAKKIVRGRVDPDEGAGMLWVPDDVWPARDDAPRNDP